MCNGVNREGVKARSDLAYWLFFIYHYTNFDMASESKLPAQPAQDLVPSPLPPTSEKQCQWCKTPNA